MYCTYVYIWEYVFLDVELHTYVHTVEHSYNKLLYNKFLDIAK